MNVPAAGTAPSSPIYLTFTKVSLAESFSGRQGLVSEGNPSLSSSGVRASRTASSPALSILHGTEVLSCRKPASKVCKNHPGKEERKGFKGREADSAAGMGLLGHLAEVCLLSRGAFFFPRTIREGHVRGLEKQRVNLYRSCLEQELPMLSPPVL